MSRICYSPQQADKEIGKRLMLSPRFIAALRGSYDTKMEESGQPKLDVSDVAKAAATLRDYRKELQRTQHAAINNSIKDMANSYRTLKNAFSAEERINRVNMIASVFSVVLDRFQAKCPDDVSRADICNGYRNQEGVIIGGENVLFIKTYETLMEAYAKEVEAGNTEAAKQYEKVLDNWHALIPYVRVILRQTEGIKLGNFVEFADEASQDDFEINVLSDFYNLEEATRESWQENNELKSAFASIGKAVRRVIGDTPLYLGDVARDAEIAQNEILYTQAIAFGLISKEEAQVAKESANRWAGYQKDDLGYLVKMNPVTTHQRLMEICHGATRISHLMKILERESQQQEWLKPLIEKLKNDPSLQTQFRNDLHKNFQLYSSMTVKIEDGIRKITTFIKNAKNKTLIDEFNTRVYLGEQIQQISGDIGSVYNQDGTVNWRNLSQVMETIKDWLYVDENETNVFKKEKFYTSGGTRKARVDFLRSTLRALGIQIGNASIEEILNDSSTRGMLLNSLRDMVKHGFDTAIPTDIAKLLETHQFTAIENLENEGVQKGRPKTTYTQLIQSKGRAQQQSSNGKGNVQEKLERILETIASKTVNNQYESRVTHKDRKGKTNSLSSYINPCYLGEFIERLNEFAKVGDLDGLKQFLRDKYLDSPYFMDSEGHILNKWLEEFMNIKTVKELERSLASLMKYKRFLGTANVNFEDFTSKQHTINMIHEFLFAENEKLGSHRMAWYPVFITGDSGIQRYIEAPVYSEAEILDGLYNVYKQELERMALTRGAIEAGVEIANISKMTERYSILTFLNEDFVSPDGIKGKYSDLVKAKEATDVEQGVKDAIKAYMEDARENFRKQVRDLGVLEVNDKGKYVYFEDQLRKLRNKYKNQSDEALVNYILDEFFNNTKFATIQQLQLMTIDPAFYKDTKDLQKRYKEIHAPGTTLSIDAWDKTNNDYYFGHRTLSDGTVVPDAIESCVYFNEVKVDAWATNPDFMKAIVRHFDKDSRYKKYLDNAFTDGQGYRTLESYRAVLGAAGQWDENPAFQRAYDRIQELRAKIRVEHRDATKAELEEMSDILETNFQPLKPYMFTIEKYKVNDHDVLDIPVQHKYAEMVLIPELLPAKSRLRDMAEFMEESKIDLMCSTTVVKVGGFGAIDIASPKNREELRAAMSKAYVHQLNYEDYKLQTNVPDHFNNQSQLFGTQIRKLILSGLNRTRDYSNYVSFTDAYGNVSHEVNLGGTYGMQRLSGENLVRFYNELITSNILDCYKLFKDCVTDIKGLSDILTQSIINNEREALDNILAFSLTGDGNFLIPLFEGATEHDSAALILSKFKKKVNKQTIQGGSAVQVSAFGIQGYDESESLKYVCDYERNEDGSLKYEKDENGNMVPIPTNILYAECEVPFDLTVYDQNGQPVKLRFTDYCNPDGSLIMEGKVSKLEKEYPGILDMIAYRIPTERAYSMINLKIVRFSHKTAGGGTLKVPAQGTTIAGFDFDIDKLYFMRKCFKHRDMSLSKEEVKKVWDYAYSHNPAIAEKLRAEKEQFQKLMEALVNSEGDAERSRIIRENDPLYNYWESAGLRGTPEEFFLKYVDQALGIRDRFVTYDPKKTTLQNPKIARDNMLIDLMRARLMDEETFESRYTPQSFEKSSNAARLMRELMFGEGLESMMSEGKINLSQLTSRLSDKSSDPEPNYDPSDPMTIVTYNQQNQVAGKLIGIFANQNANHAFSSLMHRFELTSATAISFCGHNYTDFLHCPNPEVNVDNNVAEFLAASVDAVKDPVLNFLNLNTITADAGAVLARLGYTPEEIGLLFNQPVLRDICEYCFNNNIRRVQDAIDTFLVDYTKALKDNFGETYKPDPTADGQLTSEVLAGNIMKRRFAVEKGTDLLSTDRNFIYDQIKAMELFSRILTVTNDVTSFVQVTRFTAANSIGSTLGNIYAQQMKVEAYVRKLGISRSKGFTSKTKSENSNTLLMEVTPTIMTPIRYDERAFEDDNAYLESVMDNPFAYEQCMFDMNRRVLRDLQRYYPYETEVYSKARSLVASLCTYGTLDEETINDLHSDMMVYLLSQTRGSLFDGDAICGKASVRGEGVRNREYYLERFPKRMASYLNDEGLKDMIPLLGAMSYQVSEDNVRDSEKRIILSVQNVGGLQSIQTDALTQSWEDLFYGRYDDFKLSKEDQRALAVDLFLYNFYKSGFAFTPFSFMHLAPAQLKAELILGQEFYTDESGEERSRPVTYVDFLNKIMANEFKSISGMGEFAKLFIMNHVDNKKLAHTVIKGTKSYKDLTKSLIAGGTPLYTDRGIANTIVIDLGRLEDSTASSLTIRDPKCPAEAVAFKPCLVIDGAVFIIDGDWHSGSTRSQFNYSGNGTMTYRKIGQLSELSPETPSARSLDYTTQNSNADITSNIQSSSNDESNGSVEPEFPDGSVTPKLTGMYDEILDQIAEDYALARIKAEGLEQEDLTSIKSQVMSQLSSQTQEEIEELIDLYRNAQRDSKNILVLDDNGDLIRIC